MTQLVWEKLRKLIADRIGFQIRQQDIKYFKIKIEERIKQLKLSNVLEYYSLLQKDTVYKEKSLSQQLAQKEWKLLANIITNGESFFFRDRGQFGLIANTILPKIIAEKIKAKKRGESNFLSLKVWSAGCSTGEEVYSLAIVINELIADPAEWNITIIGTDINQAFLESARKGIYKEWSFRLTDPLFKSKYFVAENKNWQVKPYLKTMVNFYQDNLIDVNKVSHYNYSLDLVICRNVFIYFDLNSTAKAVQKIASTLRPGGYFMSGHAELQGIKLKDFKPISFPESIVYQYAPQFESESYSLVDSLESVKSDFKHNINIESYQSSLSIENSFDSASEVPNTINTKKNETNTVKTDNLSITIKEIQALLDAGQYNEIINKEKEIIKKYADVKELYYLIAQAYANKNSLEKAISKCDRALEIDYTYTDPLFLLAQIAEAQNDYRKVKELLKKIIYLEPLSIAAYLDLADIYNKEKEFARSKKMYQTVYNILQQYPQEKYIDYRGKKSASNLLNYVKHKL